MKRLLAKFRQFPTFASWAVQECIGFVVAEEDLLFRVPLQSAAEDTVQPNSLTWIVVGDLAEIRGQVEALNIAPIEIWDDNGQPVQ